MNRFVVGTVLVFGFAAIGASAASANEGRFIMERAEDGFVRLDTQTGEMSLCKLQDQQIVCRFAADERRAFEEEITLLEERVDLLEETFATDGRTLDNGLPTEDEIDRTMGIIENMMRRFLGVIEEFEGKKPEEQAGKPLPDKT